MPNFAPIRHYLFYCLDQLSEHFALRDPFLDVGCGTGDLCRHLAGRGWSGRGIDYSEQAIVRARQNLAAYSHVTAVQRSLFDETEQYETVIIIDVLEHLEDDVAAIKKLAALVKPAGHLVIGVPSNPPEWRWDDDFYGHYRRYTAHDLRQKLQTAGLEPLQFWDFTFPVFWLMRRLYTAIKRPPALTLDKEGRTKISSVSDAWEIPLLSWVLQSTAFAWWPVYWLQFALFRERVDRGHALLVVARKPEQEEPAK